MQKQRLLVPQPLLLLSTTTPYQYIPPAANEQIIVMAAHMKAKKFAEVVSLK